MRARTARAQRRECAIWSDFVFFKNFRAIWRNFRKKIHLKLLYPNKTLATLLKIVYR